MSNVVIKSVVKLRRDNYYNYNKVADTFIPAKGEVCLVDTAKDGLRVIIGDGVTNYGSLRYADDFLVRGYYKEGIFFEDIENTININGAIQKLYLDLNGSGLYYYSDDAYFPINDTITAASPDVAGIMKLYDTTGQNIDGTMTQKAISDELDDKVGVDIDISGELMIFTT